MLRTRRPTRRAALALALALLAGPLALGCAPPRQRVVYSGGPVLTMDSDSRVVEALGVDGARIGAVGSLEEVRAWAGDRAREVPLSGHALLPGFIDAHGHFPAGGIYARVADLNSPPIGPVEDFDGLVAALRAQGERSDDEWILGLGYDDTLLAERSHPTREVLDRVSTERPVAAVHISGHLAAVNSRALELVGIGPDTEDPEGGRIRRDASGAPDGVLEENAMQDVLQQVYGGGLLDTLAIVREGSRRYVAAGVTTAQVGYASEEMLGLVWLVRLGLIPLRLVIWPGMELADEVLAGERDWPEGLDDRVTIGAVKLVADGSIQGYTGYLSQPYHVPPGDDPSYRGYPRIPRDELIERVSRYHAAGWQTAVHGNGDASIDDILDAFEEAQRRHPREDARPVVVHAQMTRDDQLDRMKALGVIPSFFSLHTFYWGDRHRTRFMGPERAARMSPAASALRKGVRFTIHCDAPVVPIEPLRLVWSAVNRRTRSGLVVGEAERIPPMAALRAVTIDAAFQHFEEASKGSLEPGKLADLVILSESPLDDPEHIDTLRVLETIVGGKTVYRAEP